MKLPADAILAEKSVMYQGVGQQKAVRITAKFYSSEKEKRIYLTDELREENKKLVNEVIGNIHDKNNIL